MERKDKKKLCAQCEGNIPYHLTHCPFCGFEQQKNSIDFLEESNRKSSELSSLYHPPYLSKSIGEVRKEESSHTKSINAEESIEEKESIQSMENHLAKKELIVILLLSIGGQFMMLGLMLLLFSIDGFVTLQWKSKYWYFYCLFSMPFLLLGFKFLQKFKPY